MTMRLDNTRVSFEEHNEYMREFRKAHAAVVWGNKPKCDELARLDSMIPLRGSHPIMETGGARFHNSTTDLSALVPVLKVASYKLSPN